MNYDILIAFMSATAVLAFFPGPDNIYVLTQSLVNGKKSGLATVAGLISGCLVHTTLLAFGVSAIIKDNDNLFLVIKIFGACYLFYIAFKVFKSDAHLILGTGNAPRKSAFSLFKQGFVMNVLNPKVALFFLAFFPGFLFSDTLSSVIQFYILGLIFMLVSFLIFALIAVLAGSISSYIAKNDKVGLFFKWIQIVVFIGLGIYILLSDK
ncbi:threonine/homoserine/homoserine lactone efflux protein [Cellulophaga sp. RHA19]|uniref:LysE family translocator n=1 Tax=Cellulophaga sp. RHA19 TaxID=1798237 RepID=UPI000CA71EB4|nr:LysE family translocator [Cellulophaga sp. RHA19]PKB43863.1 threonine/homoserine/homoserine lactone efflux protein [Cellulophaga sp. RHA19]